MMQIVIDIADDLYEGIEARDGDLETEYVCDELMKAIDNGTPLPKHGRLIDADKIQFENSEFDTYSDYSRAFDAIDYALTIIEADKESEVEE